MARLVTAGAETLVVPTGTASNIEGVNYIGPDANKPTIDQAGALHWLSTAAWKMNLTLQRVRWGWTGALATDYFTRAYFFFDAAALGADLPIIEFQTGANAQLAKIKLTAAMTLIATDASNTLLGTSQVLQTGVWYCVETRLQINSGAADDILEVRIDGVPFYQGAALTLGTAAPGFAYFGPGSLTGTVTMHVDDVAINDSTGGSQNSWAGPGTVIHLYPISDNARVNWTGGAGGTTNLFDALDNRPPVGVIVGSGTNTSQVKDPTNNATDTLDLNMKTWTSAGVRSGGKVKVVEARAAIGNSSTTSRLGGVQCLSNPTIAELASGSGTTAAGTFPTGWPVFAGSSLTVYDPALTLGSSPVMRLRKGTASTDNLMFCSAFLVADVIPGASILPARERPAIRHLLRR